MYLTYQIGFFAICYSLFFFLAIKIDQIIVHLALLVPSFFYELLSTVGVGKIHFDLHVRI